MFFFFFEILDLPSSMNSVTVFSFLRDELQHSLKSTIKTSNRVSVEKHFASWALTGPSKKTDSKFRSLSIPLLRALTDPGGSSATPFVAELFIFDFSRKNFRLFFPFYLFCFENKKCTKNIQDTATAFFTLIFLQFSFKLKRSFIGRVKQIHFFIGRWRRWHGWNDSCSKAKKPKNKK